MAVARIGEPDGSVTLHHHVVRGVERSAAELVDHAFRLARREVVARDARGRLDRALLADHELPGTVERHAVGGAHGRVDHGHRTTREVEALYPGVRRQRREVDGVLAAHVHRALVGVCVRNLHEPRLAAEHMLELALVHHEG